MLNRRFATFAWAVLAYNILVILWGAYTRATGSGAGCGRHWPLCNGTIVPRAPQLETIIEYSHRVTGSIAGMLVILLLIWAFRTFAKGHIVRKGAVVSLVIIIIEGWLGRELVMRELVAYNDSSERAITMALHLSNTLLLLGVLSLTAWWGTTVAADDVRKPFRLRQQGIRSPLLGLALLLVLVVSATGAITALGDTLFPARTVAEGVGRDFSPTAHFLERLRIWHPLLAVLTAIYILTMVGLVYEKQSTARVRRLVRLVQLLIVAQLIAGIVNLLLLAPVTMQLLHLLLADNIWIGLVLLSAATLEVPEGAAQREARGLGEPAPSVS